MISATDVVIAAEDVIADAFVVIAVIEDDNTELLRSCW